MKDLVKLQHGEFVSLSKVETALKMSPLVDQICIHAHGSQSWCIALVVPNQKMLTEVAAKMGIKDKSYEELCAMDKMSKEVLKQLADVGKKGEKLHILIQCIFCPSLGAKFQPQSQSKIATFFPNTMSVFLNKKSKKKKRKFLFFTFFRDHYYLWDTMTQIRMIPKHLCLSGMVGIIQSKMILRIYFATFVMFYVVNFSQFCC